MITVEEAYQTCHILIKQHSKTFAKAFSPLPRKKRNAVWAIYAFCRQVDDIVDEGQSPEEELAQFEATFSQFLNGTLSLIDPEWVALNDVFNTFEMDEQPFHEMIAGQRMDLYKKRYATLAEVENYSYHVASTVGLMLLPVLAPTTHKELKPSGIALGKAMQLTNILRDIGEDLDRDRIYIPKQLLDDYRITEEELFTKNVEPRFVQMWEQLACRAEELYKEAFKDMHLYPFDSRLSVHGAGLMYRAILKAVRLNKHDVFTNRSFVPKEEKELIIAELKP
ncbi:phytoene synthase [Bacillus sp. JCM 19046]|nr:phytoene synthase [Bacillus sp. JCM 19045]GAF17860.1 phytoene synthase [Bacillus sp. JCM 19046]